MKLVVKALVIIEIDDHEFKRSLARLASLADLRQPVSILGVFVKRSKGRGRKFFTENGN